MSARSSGPRSVCIRCCTSFTWVVDFSHHFDDCHLPYNIPFLYSVLNVDIRGANDCWLMNDPRGFVNPRFGVGRGVALPASHIVCESAHGEKPAETMLCHWCDNTLCLNSAHLYWGTYVDNATDMWRNGRRTMSQEQLDAMHEGMRTSEKFKAMIVERNRILGEQKKGDNHWTRQNDEAMQRWRDAMAEGRANSTYVSPKKRCRTCGMITTLGPMGSHLKASGHEGADLV